MAKLTKADAARQLGISRTTLYKLIAQGQVSTTPEGLIDSAELVRAAPHVDALKERTRTSMDTTPLDTSFLGSEHHEQPVDTVYEQGWTPVHAQVQTSMHAELVDTLRDQVQLLRDELLAARVREQTHREELAWLRQHFDQAQQRYDRLLDAPRPVVLPLDATPPAPPPAPLRTDPPPVAVDFTTGMPTYDPDKHTLGALCKRSHNWQGTGRSLRKKGNHRCLACDAEQARARRQQRHP